MAISPESFTQTLLNEGYADPVQVEREPNGFWDTHTHPFEAKALILQGEIRIRAGNGAEHTYTAGEIFHLAHEEPHAEWYGPQGVVYVVGRKPAG